MEQKKKFRSLSELAQFNKSEPIDLPPQKNQHDGKSNAVHVLLDTRGRKGKSVTMVSGLRHNPATMEEIARILKQHCGAGGTLKDGKIEIQGDQRERVSAKLRAMNYTVE